MTYRLSSWSSSCEKHACDVDDCVLDFVVQLNRNAAYSYLIYHRSLAPNLSPASQLFNSPYNLVYILPNPLTVPQNLQIRPTELHREVEAVPIHFGHIHILDLPHPRHLL